MAKHYFRGAAPNSLSNKKMAEKACFAWEGKPLIAAANGDCANEKTKDRAKKLDYRLRV
jgi:hypothetical protein